jgi:predicted transposase YbfD/YdcC
VPVAPSLLIVVPQTGEIEDDARRDLDRDRGLRTRFRLIRDMRRACKVHHSLEAILAVVTFGTAAVGGDSVTGINDWAREAPQDLLARLGCWRDPFTGIYHPPSERTVRRVLSGVDGDDVDRQTAAYLVETSPVSGDTGAAVPAEVTAASGDGRPGDDETGHIKPPGPVEREARRAAQRLREQPLPAGMLRLAAFDGKSMRGARLPGGGRVHLLSLFDHQQGVVLAQRQVGEKTTEVPELTTMLAEVKVTGMVLTGDALHTVWESARQMTEDHHCHYVLILKENQPTVLRAAQQALATGTDAAYAERGCGNTMTDRGHGRTETRTIRTAPASENVFPGAAQFFRIVRYRGDLEGRRLSKEVVFGITDMPAGLTGPAHLNHYARHHWGVENREHYVRDVTFSEDANQARTGQLPHVLAAIRNLVIGVFRQKGYANMAHARRVHGYTPHRLEALFTL